MQTDIAPSSGTPSADAQPLLELIGRLSTDLQTLVRKEGELAGREIEKKLAVVKLQAATLGLGIAAVAGGSSVLLAAAVLGLAVVLPAWAAALLVGSVVTLMGVVLVMAGKSKLAKIDPRPERALANVKRDVAAIKGAAT